MSEPSAILQDLKNKLSLIKGLCEEAIEDITQSTKTDGKLNGSNIAEKLQTQINSLHNETTKIKDIVKNLPQCIDDKSPPEKEANASEGNKENEIKTENNTEWKPRLKIVDISKLVDPRNLELMDQNQKRKEKDIIVLSSSDEEAVTKNKPVKSSRTRISSFASKRESRKTATIFNEQTSKPQTSKKHLRQQKELASKEVEEDREHEKYMKEFQRKAYVKLVRVPCEEMKTYFLEKNIEKTKKNKSSNVVLNEKTGAISNLNDGDSTEEIVENVSCDEWTSRKKNQGISLSLRKRPNRNENSNDKDSPSKGNTKNKSRNLKEQKNKKNSNREIDSESSTVEGSEPKSNNDCDQVMSVDKTLGESSSSDSENVKKDDEKNENQEDVTGNNDDKNDGVASDSEVENDDSLPDKESQNRKDKTEKSSKQLVEENESDADEIQPDKTNENENLNIDDKNEDSTEVAEKEGENSEKVSQQQSEEDMFADNESQQKEKSSENGEKQVIIFSDSDEDVPKKTDSASDSDTGDKRKRSVENSNDSNDSDDFAAFCKKKKFRNSKKARGIDSGSDDETEKETKSDNEKDNKSSSESKANSSDEEESDKSQKKSTKKRRIKKMSDDSSDSDSKTTRKKLKKLKTNDSLSDSTKKATAEERERKQRILEKQKKYNQIYEDVDLASSKVEKLVLDVDEKTGKPLIKVNKHLVSKLKPHQASGVQFMWDACFESVERAKTSEGSGCILAHCMGLGKTLQSITFAHTLLENREITNVKSLLIVCPLSTVINWKNEFSNWLSGDEDYEVFELVSCRPQNSERAACIKDWYKCGGIMIISYSMFRNLSSDNKRISKKFRDIFHQGLLDPGPDVVICDEGHLLKNEKTSISICMNKIRTRRRIVLTGTPLQNNLKEYYCMVQFVKPNLLGTYKEYLNRFVNPIINGQYTDSTKYDIDIMRRRSHVLHKLLDGIVQRRDYAVLAPYLPPKHEYVIFLTLSEVQKKLYIHYMTHLARKSQDSSNRTSYLFRDHQTLSRICMHPRVLLDKSIDDQAKAKSDYDSDDSSGSLKNFVVDKSDSSTSSDSSESGSDSTNDEKVKKKVGRRITRTQKPEEDIEEPEGEKEWWQEYCDGEELDNIAHSTKLLMLFEILKECEEIGDKVLVFSQSLYALNLIEYFLEMVDMATQNGDAAEKTCGYTGSWSPGLDYFRLDGSTNCSLRAKWCDSFNKMSNTRARLFLLSTKAGGLGINLVGANRVILFDVSWNPSSDVQSIYRVYRFGQLKPSYIYRFVIYGSMEMKIYERQVTKQAISKRVIDEQQIDRHYNQNDLAELYRYDIENLEERPIPMLPKDVLLAEMLQNHDKIIYKYHEHQSLLENKEEETLNEEERKAAWDEFENEKVERTKRNVIGQFSTSTIQLAFKTKLQRENPGWNESQILAIIPQLMQNMVAQMSIGDFSMYQEIATEVNKLKQDHIWRMQLQYQQRLLAAQNLGVYSNQATSGLSIPQMNLFQQLQRLTANSNAAPGPSNFNSNSLNSNNVIELN